MTEPTREQLLNEIAKLKRLERMATQHAFDAEADRDRERTNVANAKAEIARLREQRSTWSADTYAMYLKECDRRHELQERIAKVREAAKIADVEDWNDWQRGYRAATERVLAVLDGEGEETDRG